MGTSCPPLINLKAGRTCRNVPRGTHTPSPIHEGLDCLSIAKAGAKILQKTWSMTESTNKRLLFLVNYPNSGQYRDISNVWSRKWTHTLNPHSSPGNGTQESFNLSAETFTSEAKNCSPCSFSVLTKTLHSSLNVSNWWALWAELLTSTIIWNLQTPLWSEQQLFQLHHQLLDAQLGGKQLPTRPKVALALKCIQRAPGVLLCLTNLWRFRFLLSLLD